MCPAMEQLSSCATTTEPVLSSPGATTAEAPSPSAHALQQGKPLQLKAYGPQLDSSSHTPQLKKSTHSNENLALPKINK